MRSADDYLDLITPFHRPRARFAATVRASVDGLAAVTSFIAHLPQDFDLDEAIGAQLDVVGEWTGVSRLIQVPLVKVWFSWGTEGLGWGQGIWVQPAAPEYGISELDDQTYRDLIRFKIKINNWDGQASSAGAAFVAMYQTSDAVLPFISNGQRMAMLFCISGQRPTPLRYAIYATRKVEFAPAGVKTRAVVPSVVGTPAFGFGAQNDYISGWGTGSWVVDAIDDLTS